MTKRTATTLFVLFALLLSATAVVMAQDDDAPDCPAFEGSDASVRTSYYMGEGTAFLDSSQFNSAVRSFTCVIETIDDGYIPAYVSRAVAYTEQREFENAIADYTRVIEIDSSLAPAFSNRGIVYMVLAEYDLALEDFNQAISIDGEFVQAYNNRGVLYTLQGAYQNALNDFEQIISLSDAPAALEILRDPENDSDLPDYTRDEIQAYALIGVARSAQALESYDAYLTLSQGTGDARIQSAAGALESRLTFELRLDDGSFLLSATFADPTE